ncbi:MAG: hypothetical protein NVSMB62_10750 [Acidobacteriaceae bacterium]
MFDSRAGAALGRSPTTRDRWKLAAQYLMAAGAAWLAVAFSFRVPNLASTRLALSYSVVVAAAILFESGPAVVALVVSVVFFPLNKAFPAAPFASAGNPAISMLVILLPGVLTVVLILNLRLTSNRQQHLVDRLTEQAQALIQAQQASGSAAWTFDATTGKVGWYEGGAEVFGLSHAQMTAMGLPDKLILEEDLDGVLKATEHTRLTGEPFDVQFRARWPNGEIHWLEARGHPLPGNPQRWCGATTDITQRKVAEVALIRTEKLAIAGRLAAAIAHEINNPLEAVTNLCYLARVTSNDPDTRQYITMAEEELARVAQITSQTLRFHRQQSAPRETDIVEVVDSILALFEQKLAASSVSVDFDARPAPPLLCFAGEIRQVLANLIGNAIDAMSAGGRLRVRVRQAASATGRGPAVRITIADTGHGIQPQTLRRIYEPFYTTKAEMGTGLGLWVCSTLVEKHHGSMSVRSSAGAEQSGTVFVVILPYSSGELPRATMAAETALGPMETLQA